MKAKPSSSEYSKPPIPPVTEGNGLDREAWIAEHPASAGAPPMPLETWPIGRLIPYPKNAKKHSDQDIDKLAASMKEFGWRRAFVAEENGTIVIGHRMRLAAIKLGWTECPVNVATGLSKAQITALRISDNKLNDDAVYDNAMLGAELLDLNSINFDLSLTGYELTDIGGIIGSLFGQPANEAKKKQQPAANGYKEQYGVIVICSDETHQQKVFEALSAEGHNCRVVVT